MNKYNFQNSRLYLSEGQVYDMELRTRRNYGKGKGVNRIVLPKTERTNMVTIAIKGIDGVMMGGFTELQLIGCYSTTEPPPPPAVYPTRPSEEVCFVLMIGNQ